MQTHADQRVPRPPLSQEQEVEGVVQAHERRGAGCGEARPTSRERSTADEAAARAEPVTPTEIERVRRRAVAEKKNGPGDAPANEVSPQHAPEGPLLKVRRLDLRVEFDSGAARA